MSFIFADLIVPTIVHAYKRYYGWRMALTLFAAIFITAAVAGVLIHYLWHLVGLVPESGEVGGTAPSGYTLYLNLFFTLVFVAQLYVTRSRSGE
jgi:hypothetical protein